MNIEGLKNSSPVYSTWLDRPVLLSVMIRQCRVPMVCRILEETSAGVRVRIEPGWEMEIGKHLILGVEETAKAVSARPNRLGHSQELITS